MNLGMQIKTSIVKVRTNSLFSFKRVILRVVLYHFSILMATYHPHCQPAPVVGGRCWAVWSGPGPVRSQLSGPLDGEGDGYQQASELQPDLRLLRGSAGVCSSAGPRCSLEVWGGEAWGGGLLAHLLLRLWGRDPPEPDPGSLEGWEGELGNAHPWRERWHSTLDGGVDQKKGGMERRRRGMREWGMRKVWWGWRRCKKRRCAGSCVRRGETKENDGKIKSMWCFTNTIHNYTCIKMWTKTKNTSNEMDGCSRYRQN